MNIFITISQIIICLLLIGAIVLQAQGGGLGTAWGGSGYYSSKRGVEKVVLWITIVLVVLFFIFSILNFLY